MRQIAAAPILVFLSLLSLIVMSAVATTWLCFGQISLLGDFRGVTLVIAGIVLTYLYGIVFYRIFLKLVPLRQGEIPVASRQEFVFHVHVLFYLVLFNSLIRSGFIPVPVLRMLYLALGARLGQNTYSSGIIYDPLFVRIGANCIVGESSLLVPHVIEGQKLANYPIAIGSNVTIGAHAVVLAGVTIEDDAIVAVGAVVAKETLIRKGEVWGGVPARLLRKGMDRTEA